MADILLSVRNLHSYYGENHVLHGVDICVGEGETVALMGRNGMGKSTLLKSIIGLVAPRRGIVSFRGMDMDGLPTHQITRAGIAYVPEGRGIFSSLSTLENLVMAARPGYSGRRDWDLERVLDIFPALIGRLGHSGGQLSGGEQQMLSIGRALMTNPELLILDEATEGLAPFVAQDILKTVGMVHASGVAVVIVDKNLAVLSAIANRILVMIKGRVVFDGLGKQLLEDADLQRNYLGI